MTTLFPRQLEEPCVIEAGISEDVSHQITKEELLAACKRVGNKKAPGPDGIPNMASDMLSAHTQRFL